MYEFTCIKDYDPSMGYVKWKNTKGNVWTYE